MPVQQGTNKLGDRLNKATSAHASDETKYGSGGELSCPVSGRAKLIEVKMGKVKADAKANANADYILFTGIASTPPSEEGKRVSELIVLADQPKSKNNPTWVPPTAEDQVGRALNLMRILGGPQFTNDMSSLKDWENKCAILTAAGIEFTWHTFHSKKDRAKLAKDPKAQVFINLSIDKAVASNGQPEDPSSHVQDDTASNSGGDASNDTGDDTDWTALGEAADSGDQDAINKLAEKAHELDSEHPGLFKAYEKTANYVAGAALLVEKMGGSGEAGEGETEDGGEATPWIPGKGEEYKLKIAKHGDKSKTDYEITAATKTTVDLLRKKDKKKFAKIGWGNDPDQIGGCPLE